MLDKENHQIQNIKKKKIKKNSVVLHYRVCPHDPYVWNKDPQVDRNKSEGAK